MKNILFIASEAVPFIKTGGLADVVGSLPKCFDKQYFDVRVMIGLIDAEQFENGDIVEGETKYATVVKNPHSLIASARQAFGTTIEREPGSDCDIKIRGILSCLDSLERAVDKMIGNAAAGGYYPRAVDRR